MCTVRFKPLLTLFFHAIHKPNPRPCAAGNTDVVSEVDTAVSFIFFPIRHPLRSNARSSTKQFAWSP